MLISSYQELMKKEKSVIRYTIKRRLSTLHQSWGPTTAPPLVFVSTVTMPAMAVMPDTTQGDMNPDVESSVAWGHTAHGLEGLHACVHACMHSKSFV